MDDQQLGAMQADVTTMGREIGELKQRVRDLTESVDSAKGSLRTFMVLLGLAQAFALPAIGWLFTSMLQVREANAVTDYRVKEVEARCAAR